jgi:hypothetical protein
MIWAIVAESNLSIKSNRPDLLSKVVWQFINWITKGHLWSKRRRANSHFFFTIQYNSAARMTVVRRIGAII